MSQAKQDMDRRSFLAGAAAAAAGVAVANTAHAAESADKDEQKGSSSAADGEAVAKTAQPENRWQSEAGAAWRTAPDPVDDADIEDGGSFDLVIVGGGQAGTWAAKSAAKNGLKVCVIEAQADEEQIYVGGEVGTINCQWALDHGATKIDPQEFMREVFRRNEGRSNQRFIKEYVENSGRLLDEVIAEMGEEWMNAHTHIASCPPDERMVMDPSDYKYFLGTTIFRDADAELGDWMWREVMATAKKDSQELGATWLFSTHAEYLEKDADGRVTSVVAQRLEDSSYVRVTGTRGVILAGGDFAGDVDMLRDINDEYRHLAENLGDIELAVSMPMVLPRDGSALKMGVWAGGHVEAE